MLRKLGVIFGIVALVIAVSGLIDEFVHGRLVYVSPWLLGAIGLCGLLLLFWSLFRARERARVFESSAVQLKSLAHKLEASLATLSAMNARLHESEARYKGLVDAQGDAILRRTPDRCLTHANDAFFKLFGLDPDSAIGRPFAPELHPDRATPLFGLFAGRETGQARVKYDQHVRTRYGWRWIAWEDFAVRDASGHLIEIQSVGRDITERKALEAALTEARDRAEAGSRAKSRFLATMSHEIRTPMNGVLGMARLLQETRLSPEQRTYANAIEQSGESLLTLIGDILDFSKIESGTLRLEDDKVEIHKLVESVAELLGPRAHVKGIELVVVMAGDVPRAVRGDGGRLRQVLTNLVGNAVKFTELGGVRIEVGVERRRLLHLRFEVRDTGVGVPPEKRSDIFDEFVQADSSHARRFGGTGLGLAICRRLVSAMGGEIGIEQASGGGSIFWFVIPARVEPGGEAQNPLPLRGKNIAVITRNNVLREAMAAQLKYAGATVVSPGLQNPPEGEYTLLIDAGTGPEPDPSAFPGEAARSIVLVAPEARSRLPKLREIGFESYLVKPVRLQSLCERILSPRTPHGTDLADTDCAEGADLDRGPEWFPARSLRILLAEDNPVNALLTRELLRRRGHHVTDVDSGEAALETFQSERFDLVITDIHMPGLDGIQTAQRMRAVERQRGLPRTPILALTADALETGQRACEDAGMDGFLTKPVEPKELLAILERLLGEEDAAA